MNLNKQEFNFFDDKYYLTNWKSYQEGDVILEQENEMYPLILSSQKFANNQDIIKQFNIRSILTLLNQTVQTTDSEFVINRMEIPIEDTEKIDILKYFEQSYDFIEKNRKLGSVLVHCQMGVSRSASIVIAYIMKKYNMSFSESFSYVIQKRPQLFPNKRFIDDLKLYEKQLNLFQK